MPFCLKQPLFYAWFLPALCFVFFINACRIENITANWEKIDVPAEGQPLRAIWFKNTDTAYAAGGSQYIQQCLLMSIDGGLSWQKMPFAYPKGLFGLTTTAQKLYLTNYDGQIYSSTDMGQTWQMQQTARPDIGWVAVRSICFSDNENGVTVGGLGGGFGTINITHDGGISWQNQIPAAELRSVCSVEATGGQHVYFACGYGIIIRSTDGGQTWETLPANGDFFMDICFPTPQIGIAVGYQGKIIRTDDGGNTWHTLRKGGNWLSARPHFNAVLFKDAQNGWIAGDKLFWQTRDGGQSWQFIEGLDFAEFYDLFYIEGKVFIVGEKGALVQLYEQ